MECTTGSRGEVPEKRLYAIREDNNNNNNNNNNDNNNNNKFYLYQDSFLGPSVHESNTLAHKLSGINNL